MGLQISSLRKFWSIFLLLLRLFDFPCFRSGIVGEVKGVEIQKRRKEKKVYIFRGLLEQHGGKGIIFFVYILTLRAFTS